MINTIKYRHIISHLNILFHYFENVISRLTRNYEFHNHFTRQSQSLHTAVGRNEAIYKTFTFHGIRIWNYISTKISVDVSYASFKHSSKLFIKNNPIPLLYYCNCMLYLSRMHILVFFIPISM